MNKQELLRSITNYYLESGDFNGIYVKQLPSFDRADLKSLIEEDCVSILTENDDINIFINRRNCFPDKSIQIETAMSRNDYTIYPTVTHLSTVDIRESKPFTDMIAHGAEQFRILYFAVDVLELYFNNPMYSIWDGGYRGTVFINDGAVFQEDQIHSEYIKDFGVAYPRSIPHDSDRAVAVFLRDLSKLNYEAQCKWRGFLLSDQSAFIVNKGFITNLLFGEWVTEYWVFDALLEEQKVINAMCDAIQLPKLFRNEYTRESKELIGYRIVLLPSLKNYYDFVEALEKLLVNNINYKTFQKKALYIKPIDREKENGQLKGSIEMLEEWFSINYFSSNPKGNDVFKELISGVFRKVRRIRQIPAHELYDNKHDKTVYRLQNEMIVEVYHAVKELRLMFGRHPLAKGVQVPSELKDERNIVVY